MIRFPMNFSFAVRAAVLPYVPYYISKLLKIIETFCCVSEMKLRATLDKLISNKNS